MRNQGEIKTIVIIDATAEAAMDKNAPMPLASVISIDSTSLVNLLIMRPEGCKHCKCS